MSVGERLRLCHRKVLSGNVPNDAQIHNFSAAFALGSGSSGGEQEVRSRAILNVTELPQQCHETSRGAGKLNDEGGTQTPPPVRT